MVTGETMQASRSSILRVARNQIKQEEEVYNVNEAD